MFIKKIVAQMMLCYKVWTLRESDTLKHIFTIILFCKTEQYVKKKKHLSNVLYRLYYAKPF